MNKNFIDITGQKFGKLTVIKRVENNEENRAMWLCKCDCGTEKVVMGKHLRNGAVKSCGCLVKELKTGLKHGLNRSRIYIIFMNMKQRCYNSNCVSYKNYGGRDITICDEWKNDFKAFYEWAMASGYDDDLTIERIDNNKGYSPDNCRWATDEEQNKNKRSNHFLTYNGKTLCIADWAKELNLEYLTLFSRLKRNWTLERALTEPLNIEPVSYLFYNNQRKKLSEWAKEFNIKTNVVCSRLKLGWSIEKALTMPVRKKKKQKQIFNKYKIILNYLDKYIDKYLKT